MRMFKLTLIVFAALIGWSAYAEAVEVKKRREAPGTPADVWAVVGDFCAVKNWHPAVAECEEFTEGPDTFRTLTLQDGGKIKEKLTNKGATTYSYEIIESPLPVKNYSATLTVGEDDEPERVEIVWTAKFDANGTSDEDAQKLIAGIFEAGVAGIKKAALDLSDSKEGDDEDDD
ncbi:MAG: SRPBCC family protein [Methyloceanibacter sp.]